MSLISPTSMSLNWNSGKWTVVALPFAICYLCVLYPSSLTMVKFVVCMEQTAHFVSMANSPLLLPPSSCKMFLGWYRVLFNLESTWLCSEKFVPSINLGPFINATHTWSGCSVQCTNQPWFSGCFRPCFLSLTSLYVLCSLKVPCC